MIKLKLIFIPLYTEYLFIDDYECKDDKFRYNIGYVFGIRIFMIHSP